MGLARWTTPVPKPERGSGLIARKDRRKAVVAFEEAEKAKVRKRDKRCRWPHCQFCKQYKPRLEVAHVIAKGMGGDHSLKSSADQMMLLDYLTHQGPHGLERHQRKIESLTDLGTDGPCAFYVRSFQDAGTGWTMVAEETSIGVFRRD
jgi:hypothetical protein